MIYTIVNESYDVTVVRSLAKVMCCVSGKERYLDSRWEDDRRPLTLANLKAALRKSIQVEVYEDENNDWTYKIEKHGKGAI